MSNRTRIRLLIKVSLIHLGLIFCVTTAAAQPPAQSSEPKSPGSAGTIKRDDITVAPRATEDTLAAIKQRGTLRVGVAKIVPWAMHNNKGELVGFEVDIAKKLARDMGVEVELYPVHFNHLIPDLLAGRYDIISSGLSIKADRALQVNFSRLYNETGLTLAASKKLAGAFKTTKDFNKPEVIVGVLATSTAEEVAARTLPHAKIKTYEEDAALFNDLIAGKIHAAISDSPRPELVAKHYADKVATPLAGQLASFPAAFAVRRGDMDFVNFLNSWIQARTANGWLEHRRQHWFKSSVWHKDL